MRAYIKLPSSPGGPPVWFIGQTDANGVNDTVYLISLVQTLQMGLGESPFWGNYGTPALQSVIQQVWPDYYARLTQQYFAPFFLQLSITAVSGATQPTYIVRVLMHSGQALTMLVSSVTTQILADDSGNVITTDFGQALQVD